MRNRTTYEWNIRTVDGHGDTVDNDFATRLNQYTHQDLVHALTHEQISPDGAQLVLELVVSVGNEDTGLQDRGYSEVTFLELCPRFDNGSEVPYRYTQQLAELVDEFGLGADDFISDFYRE